MSICKENGKVQGQGQDLGQLDSLEDRISQSSIKIVAELAQLFSLESGHFRLQDDRGYVYQVTNSFRGMEVKTYWRCQMARRRQIQCKASLLALGSQVLRRFQVHNHDPWWNVSEFMTVEFNSDLRFMTSHCHSEAKFLSDNRVLQDEEGHHYRLTQIYKNEPSKKYWRCTWYRKRGQKCMAKAVTHGNIIVKKSFFHNHPANFSKMNYFHWF